MVLTATCRANLDHRHQRRPQEDAAGLMGARQAPDAKTYTFRGKVRDDKTKVIKRPQAARVHLAVRSAPYARRWERSEPERTK